MKIIKIVLLILLTGLLISGCSKKFKLKRDMEIPDMEWKFPRYGVESNAAIESGFNGIFNLKWKQKTSGSPAGPMNFGGGKLIVANKKGRISFFDPITGEYLGRYNAKYGVETGIVVVDSLAYFGIGYKRHKFVCLNLYNRKTVWSLPVKDVVGTPIIINGQIYLASTLGEVYSLDCLTGEVNWRDSTGAKSPAGPSTNNEIIYFPFDNGSINGYRAANGEAVFTTELGEPLVSKVIIDQQVYATGSQGSVVALEAESGQVIWKKNYGNSIWTTPVIDNGLLYYGDNNGNLLALRQSDGQVVWTYKCNAVILSSPIVVGDYIIFASLNKMLYCLNKKTGELSSKYELKHEADIPAISNGNLIYITSRDGNIYCFGN